MSDHEYPQPIQYPKRTNEAIRKPVKIPHRRDRYDRRAEKQLKVRFQLDAESNRFHDDPNYSVQSPEDKWIEVDSADEIKQAYNVPASGGHYGQFNMARYFIDYPNKIIIVYHFDSENLRWMKFVTRLRKDLELPSPPVMTMNHNAVYIYGSRGNRYVRDKQRVARITKREYLLNRRYNNRLGTSGERRA